MHCIRHADYCRTPRGVKQPHSIMLGLHHGKSTGALSA
jgi:hypothetical protein